MNYCSCIGYHWCSRTSCQENHRNNAVDCSGAMQWRASQAFGSLRCTTFQIGSSDTLPFSSKLPVGGLETQPFGRFLFFLHGRCDLSHLSRCASLRWDVELGLQRAADELRGVGRWGCPDPMGSTWGSPSPSRGESLARNGRCTAGWDLWLVWIGQDLSEHGEHGEVIRFFGTPSGIVWNSTSHLSAEMIGISRRTLQVLKHCNIQGKAGERLGMWLRHMPRLRESETEMFWGHQMKWDDVSMDWSMEHAGKTWLLKHFPLNPLIVGTLDQKLVFSRFCELPEISRAEFTRKPEKPSCD